MPTFKNINHEFKNIYVETNNKKQNIGIQLNLKSFKKNFCIYI